MKKNFEEGVLIIRGNVKEGHRTYSAFQPDSFMQKLTKAHVVLEHSKPKVEKGLSIPQDVWIIKKTVT